MVDLLVGPISSGKSTYSSEKAKEGWIIINDDSIVLAVHGGNYNLYNKELKVLYKQIEQTILLTALSLKKNVIIDRTNLSISMRKRYISIVQSVDQEVRAVVFKNEGPKIHAERRAKADSRGRSYEKWLEVALTHQSLYQEPKLEEGFTEIIYR